MSNIIHYQDLGVIDYKEAWDYQEKLLNQIVKNKLNWEKDQEEKINYFLLCEHPHVYTLGKSGTANNLLINDNFLQRISATFYKINRGGDITYHGPGQIVGYPIIDLERFNMGVKQYVNNLEEVIIRTLQTYGLQASRLYNATGVWLDISDPSMCRKICAIGVRVSRWVTMHGFALNVNTDLNYFNHINPCGFTDKGVTSLEKELGKKQDMEVVKAKLGYHFKSIFNVNF
jgi:lipoyl(octanoyl) transferase